MTDDAALRDEVLAELAWEPAVTAAHIGVTAREGIVTLTGHVGRFTEKQAAENAARRVKGVRAVAEEIEVQLPYDGKRGDDDIAAAAVDRLSWDSSLPANVIKVTVHHGWVTLTGEVEWRFQHDAAGQDVRALWGVIGVSNQTTVKSAVNTTTLVEDILSALHRSWLDPKDIEVVADGGTVTLTGHVKSWNERSLADAAAWAAVGVTDVRNALIISL